MQTVRTAKGARTLAYDALADRLFLSSAIFGATPAPTASTPRPRPAVQPDSFEILVLSR